MPYIVWYSGYVKKNKEKIMTIQNKGNKLLVVCSVVLITVLLLGSFVVSLKIENIIYLVIVYGTIMFHSIFSNE